jgi:DDE superfamily endonuclease
MLTLPAELMHLIVAFAPLFSKPVFEHAKLLLVGAILAVGKRTVTACLRVCGQADEDHFQNYHRVLNRARWSPVAGARILLGLLVSTFALTGDLIVGLDDTIERRRGAKISAKGIYRDPVRSSHSHFVKASGLRWLCACLLVEVPWAGAVWALPFLSALSPSADYYARRGRRHQKLTERAWQVIQLVARFLPGRSVVFVADSSFAVLDLLALVSHKPGVSLITRLRLDAEVWDPAPPRRPRQHGRPRVKGARRKSPQERLDDPETDWQEVEVDNWYGGERRRLEVYSETAVWYKSGFEAVPIRWVVVRDPEGRFKPQSLMSTDLEHTPHQMLGWFVRRWRMEVTFEEARAHLGMETQRQWNDRAIARTTPALLGLFSVVTLLAQGLNDGPGKPVRRAAWYEKTQITFADAIALVRRCLWSRGHFSTSGPGTDVIKIPRSLWERLTDTVCYAA